VLLAVVAPFIFYAVPQLVGATQSDIVLSSSMSPAIHAGDIVVVDSVDPATIGEGDVITYERNGELVTHRVIEVTTENGERVFRTQGDANEDPDPTSVPASAVVGAVLFHVPLVGHVIAFGQTTLGTLLLVIVPAVLLIVNEIYTLYQDATVETERSDSDSDGGPVGASPEQQLSGETGGQAGGED
jgi:signal peptidase